MRSERLVDLYRRSLEVCRCPLGVTAGCWSGAWESLVACRGAFPGMLTPLAGRGDAGRRGSGERGAQPVEAGGDAGGPAPGAAWKVLLGSAYSAEVGRTEPARLYAIW